MKNLFAFVVVVAAASLVAALENNCTCPDEVDVNCPELGDYPLLLPHPDDCSKFCICEDVGCGSELTCPPDLLYDPDLATCAYPDDCNLLGCEGVPFYIVGANEYFLEVDCGCRPIP